MAVTEHNTDRAAAVAGRFYPSDPEELTEDVNSLLFKAEKLVKPIISNDDELLAIIVPHAGYLFSGTVAASAFNLIKYKKNIERIFILGSSHHASFHGASIYHRGNYHTPLGSVAVDKEIANKLLKNNSLFQFIPEVHTPEHTIEVQLPFLQIVLKEKFKMIPIVIGTMSGEVCNEIADNLRPYFTKENLFIVSTDLSHYPEYNDATKIDHNCIKELCNNNTELFLEYLHETDKNNIPGLITSMCGWTSVLTLLYLTQFNKKIRYFPILYQNSGDIPIYGEKKRVVGYQSAAIMQMNKECDKKSSDDSYLNSFHSNHSASDFTIQQEEDYEIQSDGISALYK
jgi:MEMO1 family protein